MTDPRQQAESKRDYDASFIQSRQRATRDVATDAKIKNLRRRRLCSKDLKKFLFAYCRDAFTLQFCGAHLKLISDIQRVILGGGQICIAMPRGSGKSTILERSVVWACLYGHLRFPLLISANERLFQNCMSGIKSVLRFSTALAEDFPEVIGPVVELDDKAIRARGQHWDGEDTCMVWRGDYVRLPTNPFARERGNASICLGGGGLTGALRGTKNTLPSGEVVRPDCLLFDDCQTTDSALSLSQTETRERLVYDCIAMAGPGKSMASLMACTVISENDLSDRLLSSDRPEWISHRIATLTSFPDKVDDWDTYNDVRRQEHLGEMPKGAANKYYRKHRATLDVGCVHYWPQSKRPSRVSAIQDAMDLFFEDPRSFHSERQNRPLAEVNDAMVAALEPMEISRRVKPIDRGIVPAECTTLTGFIDVQGEILFYCLVGWTEEFGGHVVAYGTNPERQNYFTLLDVHKGATLSRQYPGNDEAGRIKAGLIHTINDLAVDWPREGGTVLTPSVILVDAGWKPDAVEQAVRDSGCSAALPAKGFGIGAARAPMAMWKRKPGERRGDHWLSRPVRIGSRPLAEIDVNYWKSEIHQALFVPITHSSSISLHAGRPSQHQMFADHMCSEKAIKVEALGRTIAEWSQRRLNIDNHYWDAIVGCAAAASISGLAKPGADKKSPIIKIRMNGNNRTQRQHKALR